MRIKAALCNATRLGIYLATITTIILTGCGGGGGGGASSVVTPTPSVVSGVASKGPLNGSTVCAFALTYGGVKGASLGSCATNIVSGNYSINLGTYAGAVLFEATGGSYIDEATGTTVTLATPLHAMVSSVTGGSYSVAITALTELSYLRANAFANGLTAANIRAAVAEVQNNFGVTDIVNTLPVDALYVPTTATTAQKTYALALATISQYQMGLPAGTSLANALLTLKACLDLPYNSCGIGIANIGTLLNTAMTTFQAGHTALAGLTMPVANFGLVPGGALTPSCLSYSTFNSVYSINQNLSPTSNSYTREWGNPAGEYFYAIQVIDTAAAVPFNNVFRYSAACHIDGVLTASQIGSCSFSNGSCAAAGITFNATTNTAQLTNTPVKFNTSPIGLSFRISGSLNSTPPAVTIGSPDPVAAQACPSAPYLGSANDPQIDGFAKAAQLDACLHRAGYPQWDGEGRTMCTILAATLQQLASTWTTTYCPYPY